MCNKSFRDGAQCGSCSKYLDFDCANTTETAYRKMNADRKAAFKCPSCKNPSSSPVVKIPDQDDKLDAVLRELREMKQKLAGLPALIEEVKLVRTELAVVQSSCDFTTAKLDECFARVSNLESSIPALTDMQQGYNSMCAEVSRLKDELSARDQWSRLNNIEIKGVPFRKQENLFDIVEKLAGVIDYRFPKTNINYISRVPTHNPKEKVIIVSFTNRYVKEDFVAAARAKKDVWAKYLGFQDSNLRVYANDHLTPEYKQLLTKTKTIAKDKNYRFVWVKFCKIHVRKDAEEKTRVIVINGASDLNKLI